MDNNRTGGDVPGQTGAADHDLATGIVSRTVKGLPTNMKNARRGSAKRRSES